MPKIQCPTCEGEGEIPMPNWANETLSIFKGKSAFTSCGVRNRISDDVTLNAINNRLEKLRSLGLLERIREGKWWLYTRASK